MTTEWFTANRNGLRQIHERIVERRGFGIIGGELYQNVMDTAATICNFRIHKIEGRPLVEVEVTDNGEGFSDLSHAWTMFAPSFKKGDPTKAGRFNLGEKVVLSFAKEATIETTTGTVCFSEEAGRKEYPRRKRDGGTVFHAILACNQERYEQLIEYMRRIIVVRDNLSLWVNGEQVDGYTPIRTFKATLQTEIGDDLRPSMRLTEVAVYQTVGDEVGMLYELGIPVVETGDKWHVSIGQKVPLNVDRDNVTPAFLRSVRVAVLNEMHKEIDPVDTMESWVNEATSDKNCSDEAAETFRSLKYGKKSVSLDPLNPEANAEAMAHDFTVIPSRGLTPGQRENLKRAGTLQSSSQAFPAAGKSVYGEGGEPVPVIEECDWSNGMKLVHRYTTELARRLMGKSVDVRFVRCQNFGEAGRWAACYGRGGVSSFDYNVFVLGRKWFDKGVTTDVDRLIIHEFGHEYASNHLCEDYHDALCRLGAKLRKEVFDHREWFEQFVAD